MNPLISGRSYIFTDGGSQFHPYTYSGIVFTLASNASIWHVPTNVEQDEKWGYLIQIDHLNTTTGVKYTRVLECDQMPSDKRQEDENCTTLVTGVTDYF
jgi:hypothetical protein